MADNFILENLGFKKPDSRPTEIAELQAIDDRLAADKARADGKGLIGKGIDAALKLVWHADEQTQKGLVDLRVKVQEADQHHDVQALAKLTPQITAAVNADVAAVKSESIREGASDFVAGVFTTVPLFMRGGRARALSVGVNALNDIHTNDGALGIAGDAIMGGAKGYALSVTFERVGRSKLPPAAKGLTLGLASRFEEGLLTRENYRNDQGQFNVGTGFERTAGSVFNPYSIIADAATFGTASTFTKTLSKNPVAANLVVGSMVGIISGANSEIQSESQTGHYSATDIVSKALLSGASNIVSAGLGGHFEQTTFFNPRVATEGRLPGSMMLPQPEGSTTTKSLELPNQPPADISAPTNRTPLESTPKRTDVLLPDWHVGPDNVDFVKTMTELVPKERNETALSLIETVSDPGYQERLVEARQMLGNAFTHAGALLEWLQSKSLIDDPEHMAHLIGQHPEVQEAYDQYTEIAKPKQQLMREIEPVRRRLEDALNIINEENGLPPVRLAVSFSLEPGTAGVYKNAQIEMPPSDFAGGRSSRHVLDTLRHEEEHHVHECLVIAGTIEQIAGNEPVENHIEEIQKALGKLRTTQDEDLIRAVDAKRNGLGLNGGRLPLSPEERTRFEAICKSFEEEGNFRDVDFDLKTTNAMLDLIEKGHLSEAIEELALLYAPMPDDGLPVQAREVQPIPEVFKEIMDENTLRDWPLHEHNIVLPTDQATLTRLAEELKAIGLAQKQKLEEQLGSESERHQTYLGWTHEREARDAEQELDTASLLLRYFQDHPFDANEIPQENAPSTVLEAAQISLQEGFPLETIRHFADYVCQGFYPDSSPPQVIRNLVGDEAVKDWPHLSFDLSLASQGDSLRQNMLAFQDFLAAESTRHNMEQSDRNADPI